MLAGGEREAMVMAPPTTCDSAVLPCFQGCPAFFHWHFPPWSPPSHPLNFSLCSQQQPSPPDCSPIPKFQLPAAEPSRGPAFLSRVCMASVRTVWFSFHLGCHRSAVSLSALNVSLLRPLLQCGDRTPASVPPPTEGRSSPTNTPVFPLVPSSYRVLRGSIYSFLLVRYSYPLSGHESECVLHALLCLKVYSWCICGKRCTLHPPTPLPSCSPPLALSVENSSFAILFYLTCSASMNLGETISYCGHTEVFLCESILMQAAYAQCLWWESWTWRVCQSHLSSGCASKAYGWLWWSYVLAWKIPGKGEPGGLPSMESHKVGHNWSDLAAAAAELTWSVRWDFLSALSSSLPYQEQDLLSDHWIRSFEGWAQGGSVPLKSVIFLFPALGPLPLQRGVLKQVGFMCLQKSSALSV